jgi:hypothetical protein
MRLPLAILFCAAQSALAAPAPPLRGQDLLTEKAVSIAPGAKGTVAVFLSARCPCSNSHLEALKKLAADFPAFRFTVIHSNADEPAAEARAYFAQAALGLPVIQDDHDLLANELRAFKTPHAYVIGTDGKILYRGGVTDSQIAAQAGRQLLREALDDVNAGRAVRTPEARTLGCVIAR